MSRCHHYPLCYSGTSHPALDRRLIFLTQRWLRTGFIATRHSLLGGSNSQPVSKADSGENIASVLAARMLSVSEKETQVTLLLLKSLALSEVYPESRKAGKIASCSECPSSATPAHSQLSKGKAGLDIYGLSSLHP